MLESISISNFTIIDQSHIDFNRGMTALTGETGAGKSILLDAIKLVLGDRADSDCVKSGTERADISVSFDLNDIPEAQSWLQQNEFNEEDECLIRRVIQATGRSKAFINGTPASLSQLKQLGEMLVDLHGQHEHQSLQKPGIQLQLLDSSMAKPELLDQVKQLYNDYKALQKRLRQAQDDSSEKQQRIDLLKLYSNEFSQLNLQAEEINDLKNESQRLSHAGQILESCDSIINTLYESDELNIQHLLSTCDDKLEQLQQLDSSLKGTHELISSALIQVQEAASEINTYRDNIELDPARLDWVNQRLAQVQSLARKHNVASDDLISLAAQMQQELDQLTLDEQDIEKLTGLCDEARDAYLQAAHTLSETRSRTAEQLSSQITEVMQTLGMQGGQFQIQVINQAESEKYNANGVDQVVFQVSANPGQPLRPMGKVASGGELSRISLAIQVILSQSSQIPTLIFDEVDSGIGGGIAEIVGRKLREIAKHRQVFCVTHLPQVASQAHQHYQVTKNKTSIDTTTDVVPLDDSQRLEEIARMLGGMTITEQTRAHAREMIESV
jgi:DNA repair protein RecN (Recombination protein N)